MSQIPPYLRIISGGLDRTDLNRGKDGVRTQKAGALGGSDYPALITISSSRLSGQNQADKVLQSVRQAHASPGELHSNLDSQRALELLIN